MKNPFIVLVLFFGFLLLTSELPALENGENAAEVKVVEWVAGKPFSVKNQQFKPNKEGKSNGSWSCLVFFNTFLPMPGDFFPLLMQLQQQYKEQNLTLAAISAEPPEILKTLDPVRSGSLSIGSDQNGWTTSVYLGERPMFPWAFLIAPDGKVAWNGEVEDLESVLESVYNGEFSREIHEKTAPLQRKLSSALSTGHPREIHSAADQVLAVDPQHFQAIRAKLYAWSSNGEFDKAFSFIQKQLDQYPMQKKNYYHALELALDHEEYIKLLPSIVEKFLKNFSDRPQEINAVASSLLLFGNFNIHALKAAELCENFLQDDPALAPVDRARRFSTLALLSYRKCRKDKVLFYAEEALKIAEDTPEETSCRQMLEYYRTAFGENK